LVGSAILRRSDAENPLKPGYRAVLAAFAKVVVASHLDHVGHIHQAANHGERKSARDGECYPVRKTAFGPCGSATTNEREQLRCCLSNLHGRSPPPAAYRQQCGPASFAKGEKSRAICLVCVS